MGFRAGTVQGRSVERDRSCLKGGDLICKSYERFGMGKLGEASADSWPVRPVQSIHRGKSMEMYRGQAPGPRYLSSDDHDHKLRARTQRTDIGKQDSQTVHTTAGRGASDFLL